MGDTGDLGRSGAWGTRGARRTQGAWGYTGRFGEFEDLGRAWRMWEAEGTGGPRGGWRRWQHLVAAVAGVRGRLRRVRLRLHLLPGGQQALQPGAGRDLRVRAARPRLPLHQRAGGDRDGDRDRDREGAGRAAWDSGVSLLPPSRSATTRPSPPATPSLTTSSSGKVGAEEGVVGGHALVGGSHLLPPPLPPRHEVEEQILGQVPGDRPHGHRQRPAAQVRLCPRPVAPPSPPPRCHPPHPPGPCR